MGRRLKAVAGQVNGERLGFLHLPDDLLNFEVFQFAVVYPNVAAGQVSLAFS